MRLTLTPEQSPTIQWVGCRNAQVGDGTDYFGVSVFPFYFFDGLMVTTLVTIVVAICEILSDIGILKSKHACQKGSEQTTNLADALKAAGEKVYCNPANMA